MGGMVSGQSGRRGRRGMTKRAPLSEINVTPFVDVMLVLLIVFMVAAPMLTAGVPIDLPSSQARPITEQDERPLEISLRKDGRVFVGESAVETEKLVPLLSSILTGNADRRIFVRADQSLPYGDVMNVMGMVNKAGFRKVALITEPR